MKCEINLTDSSVVSAVIIKGITSDLLEYYSIYQFDLLSLFNSKVYTIEELNELKSFYLDNYQTIGNYLKKTKKLLKVYKIKSDLNLEPILTFNETIIPENRTEIPIIPTATDPATPIITEVVVEKDKTRKTKTTEL